MKIKQPKVRIGERVEAFNYKRKPRGQSGVWERGIVSSAEYHLSRHGGRWQYRIELVRRTPSKMDYYGREIGDSPLFIYVGNDGLRTKYFSYND